MQVNSSEKTLVSIIVPVFNVEPFIRRCLDSIVSQTHFNLEIILVDDGSTDNSGKICDEYSSFDKRIRVIHKQNGGVSSARNVGISISKGDYIGFVDSDDYINDRLVEKLLSYSDECDVLMCRTERIYNNYSFVARSFNYEQDVIKLSGDDCFKLLCKELIDCSCYDKLFKNSLKKYLCFPEGKINEELPVLTTCFLETKKVLYIKDVLYYYVSRPNSLTTSPFNKSQFDKAYNSIALITYVKKRNYKLKKYIKLYSVKQCFYLYKKIIFDKTILSQFAYDFKNIKRHLHKTAVFWVFSSLFKLKEKCSMLYSILLPRTYVKRHQKE